MTVHILALFIGPWGYATGPVIALASRRGTVIVLATQCGTVIALHHYTVLWLPNLVDEIRIPCIPKSLDSFPILQVCTHLSKSSTISTLHAPQLYFLHLAQLHGPPYRGVLYCTTLLAPALGL